jgi:hypothetical protein
MWTDLAIIGAGAFLILVALIWKAYRVLDERLSEIQADLGELRGAILASSEAKPFKPEAHIASAKPTNERLALLGSPGLEGPLAEVDELCAKLITLVPPAEAAPLISEAPKVEALLRLKADRISLGQEE